MFIKLTRSGGHTYAQIVEAYRDEAGKSRQRTIAALGRVDQSGGTADAILNGLLRAKGMPQSVDAEVEFDCALALGDVWALDSLWKEIGFDRLNAVFRRANYTTPIEHALRVMVFNRLCDPDSKLGVLRWLQTVRMPEVDTAALTHQHLLRSMDALMNHQGAVDDVISGLLRPLVDQDLSVVFYDLTTIRAAGLSMQDDDVRHYGMSKEGLIARQFMLGVVQTAEGLPIYHEVFNGNTAESPTLKPTLGKILARFPHIERLIVVADRGLLSLENLDELSNITLPSGKMLEFILAVPGRRYGEFAQLLQSFQAQVKDAKQEVIEERVWQGRRLIVAHHPQRAKEQTDARHARIAEIEAQATLWASKLESQDKGKTHKGRRLSDGGAQAKLYRLVSEQHLSKIIKVDLKNDLFTYEIDEAAKAHAELMDGKLLLVSNAKELTAQELIKRYKALADIERGFRVLKSEIEIAPVFHRLPERIRAHASICFIALIIYRVMRTRLKLAKSQFSPEKALAQLRRIQHHSVTINAKPVTGISTVGEEQAQLLADLKIGKPTKNSQMSLL